MRLPLLVLALLLPLAAHAEKSDREKPVNLESDRMTVDDKNKVHIFEGNVTLRQGSLEIRADKMVVTQDAEGFQKGVATGNLAKFKQKREARDEYVEGEAERIEYFAKTEKADLYNRAFVKSGLDEVRGHFITYDGKTETYAASGGGANSTSTANPQGRVRAVIQPKNKSEAAPAAAVKNSPPLPLRPAGEVANPRPEQAQ